MSATTHGGVQVSTGVFEGMVSEPQTQTALKPGKTITDNTELSFAA